MYLLSTSNPWSSKVWFSSLIKEFLAASMPKVPAISKTLFVLTFLLSMPLTSNTLARLEPVVWITHSSSFWTNVTRSISGTPLTVVLRTLFLIAIAVAVSTSSTNFRIINSPVVSILNFLFDESAASTSATEHPLSPSLFSLKISLISVE